MYCVDYVLSENKGVQCIFIIRAYVNKTEVNHQTKSSHQLLTVLSFYFKVYVFHIQEFYSITDEISRNY